MTKRKSRNWLADSGGSNSRRTQANATLDAALLDGTDKLLNPRAFSRSSDRIEDDQTSGGSSDGFRPERLGKEDGGSENRRRAGSAHDGTARPWATDDAGRPRLFFHGTDVEIQAFDPYHPNYKDKGWLGQGDIRFSHWATPAANANPANGLTPFRDPMKRIADSLI